jgi:hypothetical protein
MPASRPVQVLQSVQVAGYDAVVLKADDLAALTQWLKAHRYTARPAVMDWLAPYVAQHWFITAFKIAKPDARLPDVSSAVVRISFTTDRPVYPYREPADQREPGQSSSPRLLRVFLLSTARMGGTLGASGTWPGRVTWADQLNPIQLAGLAQELALPANGLPNANAPWMTVFEDSSSPRPGIDDVYFAPASVQDRLHTPPIIETREERINVPVEFAGLAAIGAAWLFGACYARLRRTQWPFHPG